MYTTAVKCENVCTVCFASVFNPTANKNVLHSMVSVFVYNFLCMKVNKPSLEGAELETTEHVKSIG